MANEEFDRPASEMKVAATIAAIPPGAAKTTAIIFGTSLEAQNELPVDTLDPGPNTATNGRGWVNWLVGYLEGSIYITRNAGVGGNTYAQMRARIATDVLAYPSDWVLMGGPTNDISTGRSTADIVADLNAMLDALAAAGRKVLLLDAPPNSGYDTAGKRTVLHEVNAYIAAIPTTRRNVFPVGVWKLLANRSTGFPATGMAVDSVHYTTQGAQRVGRAASIRMRPLIPIVSSLQSSAVDGRSWLANPTFEGPGTGWAITGGSATTATYATEDDGWGQKALLAVAGMATADLTGIEFVENISGGRFAPGNIVTAQARIKWSSLVPLSASSRCAPAIRLRARNSTAAGGAFAKDYTWGNVASSFNAVPAGAPTSGDMVLQLPKFTIGPDVDRMYLAVGFWGAASVNVEVTDVAATKV